MDEDDATFENTGKKGRQKVNIFDDDISLDAARTIRNTASIGEDDEDEEDEITFDGRPVVKYNNKKLPPPPDLSALAVPAHSAASRSLSHPTHPTYPTLSAPSTPMGPATSGYGSSAKHAVGYGHSRSHSHTFGISTDGQLDPKLAPKPQLAPSPMSSSTSLDFDEFGSQSSLRRQPTAADIDRMQQEIQSLRRSLLGAKKDRWVKQQVVDTLRRIMKGENYTLELYKSLEDKLELIDKAVGFHDGNAITQAVLHLKATVTPVIFSRELSRRPHAADHYLVYLRAHYDFQEYISVLTMLGRTEEAAVFKYKLSLSAPDSGQKITKLRDCLRSQFQSDPQLSQEAALVQEYIDLLERQRPVDDSDANLEAAGKTPIFRDNPRKVSLIGMPVVTTLYYCCLYHFDLSENSLASPHAIKKRHQLSDRQFAWTAISARAKVKHWKDIETLLTTKGWFGGTKMRSAVGFDKVVGILNKNSAPTEIMEKYLALIDDVDLRLDLAKKVACHKAVIDTFVGCKRRADLEAYAGQFERYSKEGIYAHDVLSSSTIRWK